MCGVPEREPLRPGTSRADLVQQLSDRPGVARHHDRVRPVHAGEHQRVAPARQVTHHLVDRQQDRGHLAFPRDVPQTVPDGGCYPTPVLDRQRAGERRRRDLADAVSENRVGLHTRGPPQLGERKRHREPDRLQHTDFTHSLGRTGEHVEQRPPDDRGQRGVTGFQPSPEDRGGGQQFGGHSRPVRADPGKHEHDGGGLGRAAPDHTGIRPSPGHGGQSGEHGLPVIGHEHGSFREVSSCPGQCGAHRAQAEARMLLDVRAQPVSL